MTEKDEFEIDLTAFDDAVKDNVNKEGFGAISSELEERYGTSLFDINAELNADKAFFSLACLIYAKYKNVHELKEEFVKDFIDLSLKYPESMTKSWNSLPCVLSRGKLPFYGTAQTEKWHAEDKLMIDLIIQFGGAERFKELAKIVHKKNVQAQQEYEERQARLKALRG